MNETIDPRKVVELEKVASKALFDLHDYLRRGGDNFWREVYRHRVKVGMLVGARLEYYKRVTTEAKG